MSDSKPRSQELVICPSALTAQLFFLNIGDIVVHVLSDNPELIAGVEGAAKDFLVDEANPDVRVRAAWGDLSKWSHGQELFHSGGLWQVSYRDESYLFRFTSPSFGTLPYKVASFNEDFTQGEVYLHRQFFNANQPVYPLEYPLDELLMNHLLARGRGVEIHACGVIDSTGKGHLFVGQSEAGKTTMAKLWQNEKGIEILSDDRIILRRLDNRFWMYGTPWHGEARLASPARAPLGWVYFLRHGQKNDLMPVKSVQAIGRLLSSSFAPFYYPAGLEFTLGFYEEVTKEIPCYELRFTPDERVVKFIEGLSIE